MSVPTTCTSPDAGKLPLVLGVTGHRDLRDEDLPALEAKVKEIFAELRTRYPHTPVLLLSALAEGADRLVAWVGLAMGARLIAVLPMSRALYEQDFVTSDSRVEFGKLLASANEGIEFPLADNNSIEAVRAGGLARDSQYASVGTFLVRRCHILIALWDGVETNRVGGTSHTLRFLRGDDGNAEGPVVYHIMTPRRASAPQPTGTLALRKLGRVWDSFKRHGAYNEEYIPFTETHLLHMTKRRHALTDAQWFRLRHLLPQRRLGCPGAKPKDTRLMLDGALWIAHTGAPWRDLPDSFGPWQTVYDRFNRWRKDGTWVRVLAELLQEERHAHRLDGGLYCVDGSVIRAHKAAAGAEKKF